MKKIIGVAVVALTLILTVIYRELTTRKTVREKAPREFISVSLREGMTLSCLLFQ